MQQPCEASFVYPQGPLPIEPTHSAIVSRHKGVWTCKNCLNRYDRAQAKVVDFQEEAKKLLASPDWDSQFAGFLVLRELLRVCVEEAGVAVQDYSQWVPWDMVGRHCENVDRRDDWCSRALHEAVQLREGSCSLGELLLHFGTGRCLKRSFLAKLRTAGLHWFGGDLTDAFWEAALQHWGAGEGVLGFPGTRNTDRSLEASARGKPHKELVVRTLWAKHIDARRAVLFTVVPLMLE